MYELRGKKAEAYVGVCVFVTSLAFLHFFGGVFDLKGSALMLFVIYRRESIVSIFYLIIANIKSKVLYNIYILWWKFKIV